MKRICLSLILSIYIISCGQKPETNLIDVTAKDYSFHTMDTIPSGWTTFRFNNEGHAHHFFFLTLLPENVNFQNYISDVSSAFDVTWDSLQAGMDKPRAGALLGGLLPKWYAGAKTMGGAGIIAPGKSEETTIKLVPGNYVMECYVKTEDGRFHSALGMLKPIYVTAEISKMKEPADAGYEITLTNNNIRTKGKITTGLNSIAVHFKEQPKYGLGNDIQVVRLLEDTNIDSVINWMNWMNIRGLRTPAPAVFYGGTQEMPVGSTSYFSVDLDPGRYAWVSETAVDKRMFQEFTVE